MAALWWLLAGLALAPSLWGDCNSLAPCFSAASVVNSASNSAGALAPNTLATVYGSNLSLAFSRPQVLIGGIIAPIFFVSAPKTNPQQTDLQQINFLIPCSLKAGEYSILVMRDGWYSPDARITLQEVAPAFFQSDLDSVVAVRSDGSAISKTAPAKPGEIILLYATGLGPAMKADRCVSDAPPTAADSIPRDSFDILLGGIPVARDRVQYAGVAPGFAGLYQINLQLPDTMAPDPEIQMSMGGQTSPPKLRLYVQP